MTRDPMTDDVRAALGELAHEADTASVDLARAGRAAASRRLRRRLSAVAGVSVGLVALPVTWALLQPADRLTQPAASPGGSELVQGSFEVRYAADAYDVQQASLAVGECNRLPGLRYASSLESLPPIDLFTFLGSPRQQADAMACLEAVPAASVGFTAEEGAPVELRLSARQEGKRLQVSTGPLQATGDESLEHTLTIRNPTDRTLYVDEVRIAADLAGGALLVRSQVCGYLPGPGEPESGVDDCRSRYSPFTLGPGGTWTTLVTVWRPGPPAPVLTEGEYTLSTGVSMRTTEPFTVDDRDAADGVLFDLTYVVNDASEPAPAPLAAPTTAGQTQPVQVFFSALDGDAGRCDEVVAVPRRVPATEAVATATLEELFRGPTPEEERSYGVGSVFSAATADLLRSVRIDDGVAYVDLRSFLTHRARDTLGAAGTSCGSAAFGASVRQTLLQFPSVREVRYAFDGDPRAFVEYMQGGCPEPVPAGDPCDPAAFQR